MCVYRGKDILSSQVSTLGSSLGSKLFITTITRTSQVTDLNSFIGHNLFGLHLKISLQCSYDINFFIY